MLNIKSNKAFANGEVFCLECSDGMLVETTDTFLPYNTINCDYNTPISEASRKDRWMIGVSVMSGCPVRCKFCATGTMEKCRNLTAQEIYEQVLFVALRNQDYPKNSKEFKINYTRMGEPFLNIENVKLAMKKINEIYGGTHHYISTIGIKGSDFSWIQGNITLQLSLHSLIEETRNQLIPFKNKMSIEELGQIRTQSDKKTTVNLTLTNENDFDINLLKKYFDPKYFFIKLSPLNVNEVSNNNGIQGVIDGIYQ
jgi:adenine C2-methylase RlmN of 23S rRNA A2503 and tRNA A37